MKKGYKILAYVYMLLLAAWNGFVVLWGTQNDPQANKIWHKIGFVVRAIPVVVVLIVLYPEWYEMLRFGSIALFISHPVYNAIINWINNNEWDYLGEVSEIDGWIKKSYQWIVIGEVILILAAWII